MKIQSIRGMNDIYEPEVNLWQYLEKVAKELFEIYGYGEIRTPVLESTALFKRGVGEDTDIVEKEMYSFQDRNEESLSLRPEGTASVVRALIEHNLLQENPAQKFYYFGPMYRHERPQKGRYRQFYQYGVESFGVESPLADVEVIALQDEFYKKLDLKEVELRLSSVGCKNCRPQYKTKLISLIEPQKDKLPADFHSRIHSNPQRIFDHKDPSAQAVAQSLPKILDHLCPECRAHFDGVQNGLEQLKVKYTVDPKIVRGLDYYNRTAFEFVSNHLGAQSAVGGGGRYDELVSQLGGKPSPAVGYAGGLERLTMLVQKSAEEFSATPEVFVVAADDKGLQKAFVICNEIRKKKIKCDMDLQGKSMKSQMKKADKSRAKYCIILGERELTQNLGVLRDMKNQQQSEFKLDDIFQVLKNHGISIQ